MEWINSPISPKTRAIGTVSGSSHWPAHESFAIGRDCSELHALPLDVILIMHFDISDR
jgi:hypothetical protein